MNKRKVITLISLIIFAVIIVLPPIFNHYVYPNMSDDTANHLTSIERMLSGERDIIVTRYMAYVYVGYPMQFLSNIFHISMVSLFNWFNILSLLFVGLALWFVLSKLVNWIAGILALVIPLFVSGTILYYYYYGIVFDLISIGVLYPILVYFAVKWLQEHRVYQFIITIAMTVLTATFHTNGIYLVFVTTISVGIYIIYKLVRKQRDNIIRPIILGFGVLGVSVAGLLTFVPYSLKQFQYLFNGMTPSEWFGSRLNEVYQSLFPMPYFISVFVSILVLAILGVSIYYVLNHKSTLSNNVKITLFILTCWMILLFVIAYTHFSTIPLRQQLDASIILAIITAILAGVVAVQDKKYMLAILGLAMIGLYPQFAPQFFLNNSAVKTADKEAISYLNTLDYATYSCSSSVAPWIYDDFIKEKYAKSDNILLVVRNQDMTQGCNVESPFYDGHGVQVNNTYELIKTFDDGQVVVQIYIKE